MTNRPALLVAVAALTLTIPIGLAGQRPTSPVIVVFHDDAPFRTFPAGRVDGRARANPPAWGYLDRHVVGAVHALEAQHGFRAEHVFSATVRGFAARLTDAQIAALERDPLVAYLEADGPMAPLEQLVPWGIDRIDADISSAKSGDGLGSVTNVNVYVLDSGVDRTHPDLNVVNHVNFVPFSANAPSCAHGTRVAGVIAARDNDIGVVGVIPGAPITGVKVVSCDPVFVLASNVIKGVDWVTANAIKPAIANMSIGGLPNSTLDAAVKRSADSGVFYSIAAGNQSSDACFTSPQRAGTHPGVISTAATASNDTEAGFSSFGRCVDLWGPGVDITTTDLGGGTATSSGTSYASPHVGGTAGLFLSLNPTATAAAVENALKADAIATGTLSRDGRPVRLVYAGKY